MADDTSVEDVRDNSSEAADTSVEIISPPRRPVTRSVSAKRVAHEMKDDSDPLSSPPRPRKVQRGIRTPGIFQEL